MVKAAMLHAAVRFSQLALVIGMLGACSGQQGQQDENLETTQDQDAQADFGKDEEQKNSAEATPAQDTPPAGESGADINSATTDDTGSLDANLGGTSNGGNPTAVPPVNEMPPATASVPPPATPAPPAPAPVGEGAPIPGGRVRYVKEGGVQVLSSPGGAPVYVLQQGDHPVTWEENGWLKLATDMYVPMDALSDKGIGRPGSPRSWTTSQ